MKARGSDVYMATKSDIGKSSVLDGKGVGRCQLLSDAVLYVCNAL
jgi:hypothetical protein